MFFHQKLVCYGMCRDCAHWTPPEYQNGKKDIKGTCASPTADEMTQTLVLTHPEFGCVMYKRKVEADHVERLGI